MFYLCNIKIVNRKKEKKYAKNKNLQQMFKDPRYSDVSLSFLIFFPSFRVRYDMDGKRCNAAVIIWHTWQLKSSDLKEEGALTASVAQSGKSELK